MELRSLMQSPFKATLRRLAGFLAIAGFFAGGALTATASGPQFNNLPNDYPTLQVAKHGQQWSGSTTAQVGETVNLFVWAHNTVPGTTAVNTRVRVNLPTQMANTHVPSASVSADNAQTVTGTATINVGTTSRLAYLPGTARLYRNVGGTMQEVQWPAGVNPNDVVTGGVRIGNLDGCWQFAHAVLLQVKVEGGQPAINTNKAVQLNGGSVYSTATEAQPGDVVNFKIFLENTGNATGVNARIVDTLDQRLTYVPGSSIAKKKVNNQDIYEPYPDSQIHVSGRTLTWSFGNIAPRPDAAIYLQFQARVAAKEAFPIGTTVIQNCATAQFDGVSKDTNCVTITVIRSQDPVISFSLRKEVTNLTLGDSKWYDEQAASAAPGDRIAYRLTVINTGNTAAQNVTLKDILPANVTFDGNVRVFNAANPAGIPITGDAIVQAGYIFSEIRPGSDNYQRIVFHAKVTGDCHGNLTLVNRAQVIHAGTVKAEATATVIVSCVRGLIITKDVLNPRTSQYEKNVTGFREGDVVVFRINVQNNGNVTVRNPIVRDPLPQFTQYQANSLTIDGEFMSPAVQEAFFAGGIRLTDLPPGMGKVITFRVKIVDCPPFGDTTITNRAFVKADGIAEISDTATAVVTVRRPGLPS
jgi:uncharacterized repeat protein (TIGR01451 family)/fimbrial isopeptide formation D2 family protein